MLLANERIYEQPHPLLEKCRVLGVGAVLKWMHPTWGGAVL